MLPEKTEGLEICGGSTNRSSFDETCCAYNYNKIWGATHTWLTSTKRFTNLKVNLKRLGLYIGAKMQLVSYEFEYFYQCIMTFWGLRDSKGPILMHQAHLVQN